MAFQRYGYFFGDFLSYSSGLIYILDVRTHPPVMYTFPPIAPKPEPIDDDSDTDVDVEITPNVNVTPTLPSFIKSSKSNNPSADNNSKLTDEDRSSSSQQQQQSSGYVTLDESRGNAYSPSQQALSRGTSSAKRMSRLPTTTLNIDVRTLNLHLALRTKEILACSESMWEWVEAFQKASKKSIPPLNVPSSWSLDVTRCAILEMTRDDFDQLLSNFTL